MPKESSVVQAILDYIRGIPYGTAEKIQGTAMSSGKADIFACIRGLCIRIEVKTVDHGNKPSKKQLINLRRWAAAGAICIVAYTVEDVKAILRYDEETNSLLVKRNYSKDYGSGMVAKRVK